jgi:ketosteroid isomerase-like protein
MPNRKPLLKSLLFVFMTLFAAQTAWSDEADQAAAVVGAFNAAITARDVEAVMATLADGSVQFQLRAVHPGMSDNPPLTADLQTTWKTVGAILFPMSDVYERKSEIASVTAIGDVATVWAETKTHTVRKGKSAAMNLEFTEVYLLVKKSGEWKIAGIADNRQPDNIPVSPGE